MKRILPRALAALLLVGVVAGVACSDDGTVDKDKAKDTASQTAGQVKKETRDAWATLRTDGDKLIDQVQTRNDPEAKKQLLDRCRNTVESMRKSDQPNADQVNKLCDKIRDTEPSSQSAWTEIKNQYNDLNKKYGS